MALVKLFHILLLMGLQHSHTLNIHNSSSSLWSGSSAAQNNTFIPPECDQDLREKSAACFYRDLDHVPTYLYRDIEKLDVAMNNISRLSKTSFSRYPKLINLDVSDNPLRRIEAETFRPLKALRYLWIAGCHLHEILDNTFRWSGALYVLDLHGNSLRSIPRDTLKWLPNLSLLRLSFNNISSINITECDRAKSQFLNLDLSDNQINELTSETMSIKCPCYDVNLLRNPVTRIDADAVQSLPKTRSFSVGGEGVSLEILSNLSTGISGSTIEELAVSLTELDESSLKYFTPLGGKLSKLTLSQNKLRILHSDIFQNFTLLSELDIGHNDVELIEPDYFTEMESLNTLRLTRNYIQTINPSHSLWNVTPVAMFVDFNELTQVGELAFYGLENLTFLDLSYNLRLAFLSITPSSRLLNLQILNVSRTNLFRIHLHTPLLKSLVYNNSRSGIYCFDPGVTFKHAVSLGELFMSHSLIRSDEIVDDVFGLSLFHGLNEIKIIDLGWNDFYSIHSGTFNGLVSLLELDLRGCRISHIHFDAFEGLESLQILNLQDNDIETLPTTVLKDLGNLTIFRLDRNRIMYLNGGMFATTISLLTLTIANNHILDLNRNTFHSICSNLHWIDLSRNPLVCDCNTKWLVDWLGGPIRVLNEVQTVCSNSSATLEPLRGKPLLKFNYKEICRREITLFIALPLGGLAILVVALVAFHNRWLLRYKIFLLKLAVVGYREIQDARDHGEFEFDLNVMFADDCEQWVQDHLRPVIEEKFPDRRRIILGDDDLMLGMYYLDAVLYAVENSFKTVLLLSMDAIRDNWFMIKFRIALDNVNDTHLENMILVFMEDILILRRQNQRFETLIQNADPKRPSREYCSCEAVSQRSSRTLRHQLDRGRRQSSGLLLERVPRLKTTHGFESAF